VSLGVIAGLEKSGTDHGFFTTVEKSKNRGQTTVFSPLL
jgi:hypothetical protein